MDNSPKVRKACALKLGGSFGAFDRAAAIDGARRGRLMKEKAKRAGNTPENLRAGRLAAAIRRLNYKRDDAKGKGR